MSKDQFEIRPPRPTDLNFIQESFIKCMRKESHLGRSCAGSIFYRDFIKVIDHILEKSELIVVCLAESPDTIIGYLIYEPEVIHFALVKYVFRNNGIAKRMLAHAFPNQTHFTFSLNTESFKKISKNHQDKMILNPFILFHQRSA